MLARVVFVIVLLVSLYADIAAQITPYEVQLQQELRSRGIEEEELRALLLERGIDIDDIESLTPSQIAELQVAIEELSNDRKFGRDRSLENEVFEVDTTEIVEEDMASDTLVVTDDSIKSYAIYGHQFVDTEQLSLIEIGESYSAPDYYRIGRGDELGVSIFSSNAQIDELLTVAPDGSVMIREGRVKVFVSGLSLSEVKDKLAKNYRQYARFDAGDFAVTVSTTRKINVQVFGEVMRPGSFTVDAVNSPMHLLAAAGGFTDNASVRQIKLIKKNGAESKIDLYQLINDPSYIRDVYLEDGDYIFVPAAQSIVEAAGAIKRPHQYEIIEGDGLIDLISYAAGLQQNAYLSTIRVLRYVNDRRIIKDVPYAQLIKDGLDYPLVHGDLIRVDSISAELEDYVSVIGEVRNEGEYERTEGMTVRDLIYRANLKRSSRRDFALLKRTNDDGTINMISLSIDDVLSGADPTANLVLQDADQLVVWPQERFTDEQYIKIAGAVRYEETVPYDDEGQLKVADAILLAGGLRRDAADYAHIHRLDPLNPNDRAYVRIDLLRLMNDENSIDNIVLEPFDSVHIYSKNDFLDDVLIKISGAVNNAGEFAYGEGMSLNDAIILAGGFKRSSATNDIEISRVIIKDNQPTKTIVKRVSLSRDELVDFTDSDGMFQIEPYDNIFVRYVPEFELQQNIAIEGEVKIPGEYSLVKENETVYDLIERAGGLTEEAFPEGATLYRGEDSLGYIVMRMEEIILDPSSRYNYTLKNGDVLTIPKRQDYVTIIGATNIDRAVSGDILGQEKSIRVPYHEGKDALFYINYYAGGFADNARKDKIFVKHANGEVKTTEKRFLLGKKHPEVLPGSIVQVGRELIDTYGQDQEEDVNWTKVLGDSVAQAMSILTLVLLVQRLD